MIVCLSTPHAYLRTREEGGRERLLPIYCPPATLEHVKNIVTISPNTDHVPDFWASLFTGLSENEAIRLTRQWRR